MSSNDSVTNARLRVSWSDSISGIKKIISLPHVKIGSWHHQRALCWSKAVGASRQFICYDVQNGWSRDPLRDAYV